MTWQALAAEVTDLEDDEAWIAVRDAYRAAYREAANIVWPRLQARLTLTAAAGSVDQLITRAEWANVLDNAVQDAVADTVNDGYVAVAIALGAPVYGSLLDAAIVEHANQQVDVVDYLQELLDLFWESGEPDWSPERWRQELDEGTSSPLNETKADRWARSQAAGAVNAGYHQGLEGCSIEAARDDVPEPTGCSRIAAVRWVTRRDERVRPAHVEADQDTIPLGQLFSIDGHDARYPGDPRLPIELRINCRCVLAWVDGTEVRRIVGASKKDLYVKAQELDIRGRSKMSKSELQSALLEELCLQGLAGGPDCPDLFEDMNKAALMVHAKREKIVGRWRMSKDELIERLRATMRGSDRLRIAQGYVPVADLDAAQRVASRKRRVIGQLPTGQPSPVFPNSRARRVSRETLFVEFGGAVNGHVPCVWCGLKLHSSPDAGLAVLVPTPIRPFSAGGTASAVNMLPGCAACFQAHSLVSPVALAASGGEQVEEFDGDPDEGVNLDWWRERLESTPDRRIQGEEHGGQLGGQRETASGTGRPDTSAAPTATRADSVSGQVRTASSDVRTVWGVPSGTPQLFHREGFHLQGQHDQKTHGNREGAAKKPDLVVGRSYPATAYPAYTDEEDIVRATTRWASPGALGGRVFNDKGELPYVEMTNAANRAAAGFPIRASITAADGVGLLKGMPDYPKTEVPHYRATRDIDPERGIAALVSATPDLDTAVVYLNDFGGRGGGVMIRFEPGATHQAAYGGSDFQFEESIISGEFDFREVPVSELTEDELFGLYDLNSGERTPVWSATYRGPVEIREREGLATQFHLQGQHDQKTHGNRESPGLPTGYPYPWGQTLSVSAIVNRIDRTDGMIWWNDDYQSYGFAGWVQDDGMVAVHREHRDVAKGYLQAFKDGKVRVTFRVEAAFGFSVQRPISDRQARTLRQLAAASDGREVLASVQVGHEVFWNGRSEDVSGLIAQVNDEAALYHEPGSGRRDRLADYREPERVGLAAEFHLQGEHDQSTHGNRGNPRRRAMHDEGQYLDKSVGNPTSGDGGKWGLPMPEVSPAELRAAWEHKAETDSFTRAVDPPKRLYHGSSRSLGPGDHIEPRASASGLGAFATQSVGDAANYTLNLDGRPKSVALVRPVERDKTVFETMTSAGNTEYISPEGYVVVRLVDPREAGFPDWNKAAHYYRDRTGASIWGIKPDPALIEQVKREWAEQFHLKGTANDHNQADHAGRAGVGQLPEYARPGAEPVTELTSERPLFEWNDFHESNLFVQTADGDVISGSIDFKIPPQDVPALRQRLADTLNGVADGYEAAPLPNGMRPQVKVVANSKIQAPAAVDPNGVYYDSRTVLINVADGVPKQMWAIMDEYDTLTANPRLAEDWAMPAAATTTVAGYLGAHEYGHVRAAVDADDRTIFRDIKPMTLGQQSKDPRTHDVWAWMSTYARSNEVEAHAEAFAEWALTDGETTNRFAQGYADIFDWGDEEQALAASAPKPVDIEWDDIVFLGDTLDGPVYVTKDDLPAVAEFHLAGTANDHDQSTHGRGSRLGPRHLNDQHRFKPPDSWDDIDQVKASVTAMLQQLTWDREERISYELARVVRDAFGSDEMFVYVDIYDEADNKIGSARRRVARDGSYMVADELNVDESRQGIGIGTELQEAFEDLAAASGVPEVFVTATKVGRYAWARAGYDWDEFGADFAQIGRFIDDAVQLGRLPASDAASEMVAAFSSGRTADLPTPFEVSELLGRDLMTGHIGTSADALLGRGAFPKWNGRKQLRTALVSAAGADRLAAVRAAYADWWPIYPVAADPTDNDAEPGADAALSAMLTEQFHLKGTVHDHDQSTHARGGGGKKAADYDKWTTIDGPNGRFDVQPGIYPNSARVTYQAYGDPDERVIAGQEPVVLDLMFEVDADGNIAGVTVDDRYWHDDEEWRQPTHKRDAIALVKDHFDDANVTAPDWDKDPGKLYRTPLGQALGEIGGFKVGDEEFRIEFDEGSSSVRGKIIDVETGEVAGGFEREFDGFTLYNNRLEMVPWYRGRGIGTTFANTLESAMAGRGAEQTSLTAVDVGKYAWAARGYEATDVYFDQFDYDEAFEAYSEGRDWSTYNTATGWLMATRQRIDSQVMGNSRTAALERLDRVPDQWEFDGVHPGYLIGVEPDIAKSVLLDGPRWQGNRYIADSYPWEEVATGPLLDADEPDPNQLLLPLASTPWNSSRFGESFHLKGTANDHDQADHGNRLGAGVTAAVESGARVLNSTEADREFAEREGNARLEGDGDCYSTAARIVMDHIGDESDRYRLVHGVVSGQGDLEGVRFGHGWVERSEMLSIPDTWTPEMIEQMREAAVIVIDKSNGNDVELPRSLYYQLGRVDPDTVVRYTAEEMANKMVTYQHFGPWDDDDE